MIIMIIVLLPLFISRSTFLIITRIAHKVKPITHFIFSASQRLRVLEFYKSRDWDSQHNQQNAKATRHKSWGEKYSSYIVKKPYERYSLERKIH